MLYVPWSITVLASPFKLFMICKQGISTSASLGGQFNQWSPGTSNTHGQHLFQHKVEQSQTVSSKSTAGGSIRLVYNSLES